MHGDKEKGQIWAPLSNNQGSEMVPGYSHAYMHGRALTHAHRHAHMHTQAPTAQRLGDTALDCHHL